jgi:hypothetical protein
LEWLSLFLELARSHDNATISASDEHALLTQYDIRKLMYEYRITHSSQVTTLTSI